MSKTPFTFMYQIRVSHFYPELTSSASLASHLALRESSLYPSTGITGRPHISSLYTHVEGLNSGPHNLHKLLSHLSNPST